MHRLWHTELSVLRSGIIYNQLSIMSIGSTVYSIVMTSWVLRFSSFFLYHPVQI